MQLTEIISKEQFKTCCGISSSRFISRSKAAIYKDKQVLQILLNNDARIVFNVYIYHISVF